MAKKQKASITMVDGEPYLRIEDGSSYLMTHLPLRDLKQLRRDADTVLTALAMLATAPVHPMERVVNPKPRAKPVRLMQRVKFLGYANPEPAPMFCSGQILVVVEINNDPDNAARKIYTCVSEDDKEAYGKNHDSVDCEELYRTEIEPAKG